jgi:hypothetical protein
MEINCRLMETNFVNGVIKSPEDKRDFTIDKVGIALATTFPENYTVPYLPDIYNQGNFGLCNAFSVAKIKEAMELKERGVRIRYSPAFIYANRADNDWQGEGMMPRESLKRICRYGVCEYDKFSLLNDYPNCRTQFISKIKEYIPIALPQKIKTYVALSKVDEIKTFLMNEQIPVLFAMSLTNTFFNTGADGIMPKPEGEIVGGHAMIIVGYRLINNREYWIVSNSWGEGFGDKGYCYIPIETPLIEVWGLTDRNPNEEINKPQLIQMIVGDKMYATETEIKYMDVAPFIKDGRTFVPIRFVAEALGYKVDYYTDSDNRKIIIITDGGEVTR